MLYSYIAYTKERKIVKGRVTADTEKAASDMLNYGGFQVVSLKIYVPFFEAGKLPFGIGNTPVKERDVIFFSRQLALLIESGIDIDRALDLLQQQMSNRTFRAVINDVIAVIHEGGSLSVALSKHPEAFPQMYHRAIAAGEQGGNLSPILRRMAEFMERSSEATKKIKSAMTYPTLVVVLSVITVAVLVTFVLPVFTQLFTSFGGKLPIMTQILINIAGWSSKYGLYMIIVIVIVIVAVLLYIKTPSGGFIRDRIFLRLPVLGHINLLNQLSYICRIMALLFKVGLPPPDILNLAISGTSNQVIANALKKVQEELIQGESMSKSLSRRPVFLSLFVQMVAVGEETGALDQSLNTVAEAYEAESDERTHAAIGLIQPTLTILLAGMVGFIVLAMIQAMYGMYSQINF